MALLLLLQQSWQELHKLSFQLNPLLSLLILFTFLYVFKHIRSDKPNLPPSPPKLPFIGNLHQLGTFPHRSLQALSKKYGPIMHLDLGHTPTLVVSSVAMAREVMKTQDIIFSNRPKTTSANIFLYGCTDVAFSSYGEYWRQAKKICVLELLSLKRVQSFQYVRDEEVAILINNICESCLQEASLNLSDMLIATTNNIVSRCVLGQKFEGDGKSGFGHLSRRIMELFTAFCLGDFFPFLKWIDVLTGIVPSMKATFRELDAFFDEVMEEHKMTKSNEENPSNKDFRAQEEVRRIVGKKSKIVVNDITQMDYLKCVIKETLRLHPPIPLMVPRETSTSVKFGGYDIPPKTRVFVNSWAVHRDPEVWDRPEEFLPERFIDNPIDFKGQDFELFPFGCGRRACPGYTFGVASIEYVVANLLYWFDWRLPNPSVKGEDLDMSEVSALVVSKKIPLHLVPSLHSP
ncbi:psoralen synthase [Quercus suber]|uniref:Psoralen synthase n=1 Tax=Quercus suber TaxID=58331 RepID=A0AAW0LK30_QUESU